MRLLPFCRNGRPVVAVPRRSTSPLSLCGTSLESASVAGSIVCWRRVVHGASSLSQVRHWATVSRLRPDSLHVASPIAARTGSPTRTGW